MKYNRLLFVALVLVTSSTVCAGQNNPINVGVHISGEALPTSSFIDKFVHFNGTGPWLGDIKEEETKWDYCVSAGLDLSKKVTGRCAFESGIVLMRAHSNSLKEYKSSKSSNTTSASEIDLNYIVVPVIMRYDLLQRAKSSLYCAAGISVGCSVWGREVLSNFMVEPTESSLLSDPDYVKRMTNYDIDSHLIQFSTSIKAGFEHNISSSGSVFAEIGINYHLNDRSDVYSYFQQHPLSPNVSIGLCFSL